MSTTEETFKQDMLRKAEAGLRAAYEIAGFPPRPVVVCLCGSTRYGTAFAAANLERTLADKIARQPDPVTAIYLVSDCGSD